MLVEHDVLDPTSALVASPAIVPETIVVDHGKIYVGETLTSACRQMGISIQPARIREGRDKGPVERFFRTIREGFLQELPGYKGPDVYSRGAAPENGAFLFIDEMEALLREWVATVYHRREHDGIGEAGLWALRMSPTEMFEHGLARAGYIEAPRDPCLAYQFLQVVWRTIQHYGVEINRRIYRASGTACTTSIRRARTNTETGNGRYTSTPTTSARCTSSTSNTLSSGTFWCGPKPRSCAAR